MGEVSGFSKLTKQDKINWICDRYFGGDPKMIQILKQYENSDEKLQKLHDDFIENTVGNFYLPYAVAPNFLIDGKFYTVPMAIEESSVVAAASYVAKLWSKLGGFKTEVISTEKVGQIHLNFKGNYRDLKVYFDSKREDLELATKPLTQNMEKRGGGILSIDLIDKTDELDSYYQVHVLFETKDSMGANFINSCLEAMASVLRSDEVEVVMSILSNYVPNCVVRAEVRCAIKDIPVKNPVEFAHKFKRAVDIAEVETYRAVTHNKGIMNGIDAVVLATGNDFRAIEAGVHAYAAKDGKYKSLSHCEIQGDEFLFYLELPLALGTVGGLTALHPLAKLSLDLLGNPGAKELMSIMAAVGLAQNFGALRALVTSGIQAGHMKMHLSNILNQEGVDEKERARVLAHFSDKNISHREVVDYIKTMKND